MSKNEKVTEVTEEKKMTKYDLKMQKRKEAKEKEKKEKRIEIIISVVAVAALVCLIASFPIRTYRTVNKTIATIGGHDISKVEFDYNYNVVKDNYLQQYGTYLSMFGLDVSKDLNKQMYSDVLTWKDYFEQETVASITRGKALKDQADAAGFTYDTDEAFESFKQSVTDAAKGADSSAKSYLQQVYGLYATFGRLEEYVRESAFVNAYYAQVSEEKAPTDEQIQAEYDANRNNYDSVDYYMTTIKAELPTEPTELADPVEETVDAEAADETAEVTEEKAYEPSEAEIAKAMEDAEALADAAEKNIEKDGELSEGAKYTGITGLVRDWLFDENRKDGDTTVIEDTAGHQYYVVSFVKRYLDETPAANMHIISKNGADAQAILDEWKNGDATEESFAALADKYNEGGSFTAEGGYYEGVTRRGTHEELAAWLYEEGRAAGDTTVITTEDGNSYVLYYAGQGEAEWKMSAKNVILTEVMESYLQEISEGYEVEDPDQNLFYLTIEKAKAKKEAEAAAAATEETAGTVDVDSTESAAE